MGRLGLFGALKVTLFIIIYFIVIIVYSSSRPIGTVDVGTTQ